MKKVDPTITVRPGMRIKIEFLTIKKLNYDFALMTDSNAAIDETDSPRRQLFFIFKREREREMGIVSHATQKEVDGNDEEVERMCM